MIDLTKPIRHRASKRPVTVTPGYILKTEHGTCAFDQAHFEAEYENVPERYTFDFYTGPGAGFRARGQGRFVRINIASHFGEGRAFTDLEVHDAEKLCEHLCRWLADREGK